MNACFRGVRTAFDWAGGSGSFGMGRAACAWYEVLNFIRSTTAYNKYFIAEVITGDTVAVAAVL